MEATSRGKKKQRGRKKFSLGCLNKMGQEGRGK